MVSIVTNELIERAYILLKSEVYHETYNLFLKKRIARFEHTTGLKEIETWLIELAHVLAHEGKGAFTEDIRNSVSFKIMPKSVKTDNKNKGTAKPLLFISNETIFDKYTVEGANFIIDCPVHLLILDCLWTVLVGPLLENTLSDTCYGYRLHNDIMEPEKRLEATALFKYYPYQYSTWRDNAFHGIDSVLRKDNVAVLSLDIQKCYYHVHTNWKEVVKLIKDSPFNEVDKSIVMDLTDIVKQLHESYWSQIYEFDERNLDKSAGLPIGLISSRVLCNFHLNKLDNVINQTIRPEYYGRYVDDLLLVIRTPDAFLRNIPDHNAEDLLESFFLKNGIALRKDHAYSFMFDAHIKLQYKKVFVCLLKKKHSKSAIEIFKRELQRNVSEMRFMPEDFDIDELDRAVYGVSGKHRPSRFRDLFSDPDKATAALKEISKLMIVAKTATPSKGRIKKAISNLKKLFCGINLLSNHMLWEKINTFLVLVHSADTIETLYESICSEINKIGFDNESDIIKERLLDSIREYFSISWAMALSLLTQEETEASEKPQWRMAKELRNSCLVRDQYISFPVIEYTDYPGELISGGFKQHQQQRFSVNKLKIRYAPRYIHFHEYLLAYYHNLLTQGGWAENLELTDKINEYFGRRIIENDENNIERSGVSFSVLTQSFPHILVKHGNECGKTMKRYHSMYEFSEKDPEKKKFKIALANMKVDQKDIAASYDPSKTPNTDFKRFKNLNRMLNSAVREECDMFVMPEFAMPHSWLAYIVAWVWRNQIGIVCGLEHIVHNKTAYNLIATILPFKDDASVRHCYPVLRIKNHYAPPEKEKLADYRLAIPLPTAAYDLFNWRDIDFSPYLCYEMADINHRSLFLSELDIMIACMHNMDVHYFGDIVDSLARDLHCYVVQANTSDYGDSCIVQPTKSDTHNIIRVKGGENSTILTATIDIKKLRDFQLKSLSYSEVKKDDFKHTPPGLDPDKILKRCKPKR